MKLKPSSDVLLAPRSRLLRLACGISSTVAIVLLSSCESSGGGPFVPPPGDGESGILVRGTIVDGEGDEVFGTIISVLAYEYDDDLCGTDPVTDAFEGTVNEEGGYAMLLSFDRSEFDACLDIEVTPPLGSGFQVARRSLFDQEVNEFDSGEAIVAVTVDFVLQEL